MAMSDNHFRCAGMTVVAATTVISMASFPLRGNDIVCRAVDGINPAARGMTFTIHGISASKGIAIGRVHAVDAVDRGRSEVVERRLDPSRIEAEVERFGRAVDAARLELRAVKARIPEGTPREIAAFIDTHLLMLDDEAISTGADRLHPRDAVQRGVGPEA